MHLPLPPVSGAVPAPRGFPGYDKGMSSEAKTGPFHSLYSHGFVRLAVCVPRVKVAAPAFNAERTVAMARDAAGDGAALVLFPEMGLSAYSNDDLFHQDPIGGTRGGIRFGGAGAERFGRRLRLHRDRHSSPEAG